MKSIPALLVAVALPAHAEVTVTVTPGADIWPTVSAAMLAHPHDVIKLTPSGGFGLSAPLRFVQDGGGLAGDGPGQTTITYTGAPTAECALQFGPATPRSGATIAGNSIRDLSLNYGSADTSGCGIKVQQAINYRLTNVEVNNFLVLIDLAGASNVFLNQWKGYSGGFSSATMNGSRYLRVRAGYSTDGAAGQRVTDGVFISNASLAGPSGATPIVETGIELAAADGFYMSGPNYVGEAATLLDIIPESRSSYITNVIVNGAFFDGNLGQSRTGIRVRENPAYPSVPVRKIAISGNTFATLTEYGIQVDNRLAAAITISGNIFERGRRSCLDLAASAQVSISGNAFTSCGGSDDASTGAISYNGNNSVVAIVGNSFAGTIAPLDIAALTRPVHIQQGFNATTNPTMVPTLNH